MVSKVRYYTDEHVSKAVILGLRAKGIDVLTVPDAGLLGATDEEHMALAHAERRVIFSHDVDFLRLAAQGHSHAGIVYAPQQAPVAEVLRGLVLIFHVLSAEEMIGAIEFI